MPHLVLPVLEGAPQICQFLHLKSDILTTVQERLQNQIIINKKFIPEALVLPNPVKNNKKQKNAHPSGCLCELLAASGSLWEPLCPLGDLVEQFCFISVF